MAQFQRRFAGSFTHAKNRRFATRAVRGASSNTAMRLFALSTAIGGLGSAASFSLGDTYGNNGGINLNLATSWQDETTSGAAANPPGASDIAQWDSLSGGGAFNLGTGTTWLGITFANPASNVSIGSAADITAGGALTISTSGINMSAATQNLTIVDPLTLGDNQNWNVASGRVLTVSGTLNTNGLGVTVAGAGNVSGGGIISGGGSIIMSGSGTLSLTKTNTYSGGTQLNSGTLAISTAAGAGTGTINLSGGTLSVSGTSSTVTMNNAISVLAPATITGGSTQYINCVISGSTMLNISVGSGSIFDYVNQTGLSGFSGTLELGASGGTVDLGNSHGGGSTGTGLLDMGTSTAILDNRLGGTITIGALAGGAGTNLNGSTSSNTTVYSVGSLGTSTVFAGSITNMSTRATALTVTGGTLALTGTANTFTGGTTISGGTLQIGNGGTVSSGSVGTATVTNNSFLAFNPGSSSSITIANVITGGGLVSHIGPGTTTLNGNNTYSGGTNVSAGTLVANNATSALGTGPVTITGGTLGGVGTITGAVTAGPGAISAGSGGVGTLNLNSLTLNSGSVINTYFVAAGPTNLINIANANGLTVNGGGIDLYTVGNGALTTNGTYNIFQFPSPYTGTVPANLLTVLNPPSFGTPTYTWGVNGNDIAVTVGGLASTSQWQNNGGGSWGVAGNWTGGVPNGPASIATFASSPGITAPATVTLDGSKTVGNVIFNNATGNGSTSYTIAPGSGGSLTIDNGGNLAAISDLNGTQLISVPLVLNNTALLTVTNATDLLSLTGALSGAGGVTIGGSGTVLVTASNSYMGATNVSSGTLLVGAGSTGSIPTGAVIDNGTLGFNVSSGTTITNPVSGTGGLLQAGAGSLIYSGAGTYTGGTNVSAGSLQIATGATIGTGPLIVAGGAELDINGMNVSAGTLSGAGIVDNVAGAGTPNLTIGAGNGSSTFGGTIRNTTGTINLVKVGTGVLTLAGPNTYTGTTNVSAGTLVIATGGSVSGGALIGQGFQVSGGSLTVTAASSLTAASNDFLETAGTVSLGTLTANNADATFFNVSGGTFSATSINIPRSASFATAPTAAAPLAGATNSGFYVHGTANASLGTLAAGTNNSSSSIRIDNGILSVSGEVQVGGTNGGSTRWTILQVNGGTFNSTDATNGVILSPNNAAACDAELYVSAGVANIQKIGFGLATDTVGGKGFLIVAGTGALYLGSGGIVQNNTTGYSTTIDLNAGTIGANASWTSSLPMNLTGVGSFTFQAGNASGGAANIALSGNLSGTGSLAETGLGTLSLSGNDSFTGGTTVSGNLLLASPGALPAFTALTINTAATTTAANHSTGSAKNTLFTSSLNNSGTLDLGNNDMVVQNGSLSNITSQISQGYDKGAWNGPGGILSSAAANDSTHLTALGAIQNTVDGTTSGATLYGGTLPAFDGATASSGSDVLVKYTYYGDTDLSGVVDGSDYSRIDNAFLNNQNAGNAALTGWFNGDFNYDGVIDGSDYTLIDNAFNTQGAQIAAAVATAQIAGSSAVPEPASIGLIAIAAAGMLGRRRRRTN